MTPNQIDMSGYNNQYIDSSPGTEYSTLSVSPPNSGIQNVILDNEVMYPSKMIGRLSNASEMGSISTNYINLPNKDNITRNMEIRMHAPTSTISSECTYPDLSSVDYDIPRQIMEGHLPRKGSLPLTINKKVSSSVDDLIYYTICLIMNIFNFPPS